MNRRKFFRFFPSVVPATIAVSDVMNEPKKVEEDPLVKEIRELKEQLKNQKAQQLVYGSLAYQTAFVSYAPYYNPYKGEM